MPEELENDWNIVNVNLSVKLQDIPRETDCWFIAFRQNVGNALYFELKNRFERFLLCSFHHPAVTKLSEHKQKGKKNTNGININDITFTPWHTNTLISLMRCVFQTWITAVLF